jgi:hypothetical protein
MLKDSPLVLCAVKNEPTKKCQYAYLVVKVVVYVQGRVFVAAHLTEVEADVKSMSTLNDVELVGQTATAVAMGYVNVTQDTNLSTVIVYLELATYAMK